jgi:hypothetical protein
MKTAALLAFIMGMATLPAAAASDFEQQVLAAHNSERAALHLPPLAWDGTLAAQALVWARHLAETGALQHSARDSRPGEGENLWMGTAAAYSPQEMVDAWIGEKRMFHNGVFPDVSVSGKLQDVGHYTQMIWKDTTQIGCGAARSGDFDVLVCRYSPPGNLMGEKPY